MSRCSTCGAIVVQAKDYVTGSAMLVEPHPADNGDIIIVRLVTGGLPSARTKTADEKWDGDLFVRHSCCRIEGKNHDS